MSYGLLALSADPAVPIEQPTAPLVCPDCSYLDAGTCRWCPDHADIPGCDGCVAHHRAALPWYKKSEIIVPMGIAVATTVVAGLITQLALRRLRHGGRGG